MYETVFPVEPEA